MARGVAQQRVAVWCWSLKSATVKWPRGDRAGQADVLSTHRAGNAALAFPTKVAAQVVPGIAAATRLVPMMAAGISCCRATLQTAEV
jgi:hypothetical protein